MAQQTIKMCTGCGWVNTQPLGISQYGKPYSACCPDNNYKEVTAVEWLSIMLRDSSKELFDGNIFKQAKAMEKEQIMKAFSDGQETPINNPNLPHYSREEYYNEMYQTSQDKADK